jgi:collagenase-like PrtC family protease
VEVSTIAHVNSVPRAKFFESLGADAIMLDANINRDFKLLKAVRGAVKCELGVLVNTGCLYQCPYEYYHNNTLGHASQKHNRPNSSYMDYCVFRCALNSISDTSQLIKRRWIRPEDLSVYEKLGIDFFKVGGRAMPTDWIINATAAYSSRCYQGNLHDILNNFSPNIGNLRTSLTSAQMRTMASPPKFYIDNQALSGFINFFKKGSCLSGCGDCRYCQEIADKVVRFDHYEADKYMSVLEKLLQELISSNIFGIRNFCPADRIGTI